MRDQAKKREREELEAEMLKNPLYRALTKKLILPEGAKPYDNRKIPLAPQDKRYA